MPLINCIDCGKKFSNLAVACPKCAAPTSYSTDILANRASEQPKNNNCTVETKYLAFDLLEAETCNKVMDYYWALHREIERLGGNKPEHPEYNEQDITRAVISRILHSKRILLTFNPIDGKPHIQFIPNNCWILDNDNIVKIIGDREGPVKELLPEIIQAAVNRLAKEIS